MDKQGLLVKREFDEKIMREISKNVVPQTYIDSILTLLHVKLMHPTVHQLLAVFSKYFFVPNSAKGAQLTTDSCHVCTGLKKLPSQIIHMEPSHMPKHPGSHVNVDIIKRANQNIIVCADILNRWTVATLTSNQNEY